MIVYLKTFKEKVNQFRPFHSDLSFIELCFPTFFYKTIQNIQLKNKQTNIEASYLLKKIEKLKLEENFLITEKIIKPRNL